jgi:hypothetical protein
MSIDRGTFVRTGASAVVAGAALPLLTPPLRAEAVPMARTRLETFSLNATDVANLRNSVAAMKVLPAKDPRSWFWQSAIHSVLPSWIATLPVGTAPSAANQAKYWNKCPHTSAHGSAEFLIWHRAYLYFFERILRAAGGHPNLSLPYWNYINPAQRHLPAIYRTPTTGNALYIPDRTPALNNGSGTLSAASVDDSAAMASTIFFGTVAANFGGYIEIGTEPGSKGLIEQRPHDTVHGAIGSPGWMGSVPTAAFDPIFWPHHAEIDHLFTLWACAPHGWGPPSSYDAWWDHPVGAFVDADGSTVTPLRREFATNRALGVRYDDERTCLPLQPPPPSGRGFSILSEYASSRAVHLGTSGGLKLSASEPATSTVSLDAKRMGGPANRMFAAASPRKLVLAVNGISYPAEPSVAYDVYAGLPEGTKPDPHGPYHIGSLTFFSHPHAMDKGSQLFDISALARTPGFDASKLDVTFVPFDLVVTEGGAPGAERRSDVQIAGFDVREVTATTP